MRIAFVHYHLKTGGVTTVIKQQIEAVRNRCDLLVLTGMQPEAPLPCDTMEIPGLGYDRPDHAGVGPEDVAAAVAKAIHAKWPSGCNILHVHNPTLAKNKNFIKILKALQQKGLKLFLQIHDFAEDGRPLNYFHSDEYVADCHYGVINSRDYDILLKAGLKAEGLHKISNTITPFRFDSTTAAVSEQILYPIRAIRRKNIGEAILLSLFFTNNETLMITLPPNSPMDSKSYGGWKTFVKEMNLNVVFDAGLTHEFSDLVLRAKFLISTSITEGFGLSFLESWTGHKILWGRKLPDICQDFETNGIRLDHLYTRLLVPITWFDTQQLFDIWRLCIQTAGKTFHVDIDERAIVDAFKKITAQDTIDFGMLNEAFQKQVIAEVLTDPHKHNRLIELNPFLLSPGKVSNPEALIRNNRQAILTSYNQALYTENLMNIYQRVMTVNVSHQIDKTVLSSEFLNLENFSLLKWGPYAEA